MKLGRKDADFNFKSLNTNISSAENWWLEDDSCPFQMVPFLGTCGGTQFVRNAPPRISVLPVTQRSPLRMDDFPRTQKKTAVFYPWEITVFTAVLVNNLVETTEIYGIYGGGLKHF